MSEVLWWRCALQIGAVGLALIGSARQALAADRFDDLDPVHATGTFRAPQDDSAIIAALQKEAGEPAGPLLRFDDHLKHGQILDSSPAHVRREAPPAIVFPAALYSFPLGCAVAIFCAKRMRK